MKTDIEMVNEFHEKFGIEPQCREGEPYMLTSDAFHFRQGFMNEELEEFETAYIDGDPVRMTDALLDLVYVTTGTALLMGITPAQWQGMMTAVHQCNMNKVRAQSAEQSAESTGRGSSLDVIKPEGWSGPEGMIAAILSQE